MSMSAVSSRLLQVASLCARVQTFKTRQDKLISYSEEQEQRLTNHVIPPHTTPATALSWETASSSSFTATPMNMRHAQSPVHRAHPSPGQ